MQPESGYEDDDDAWRDELESDVRATSPLDHLNGHARVDNRPEVRLGKDLHRVIHEAAEAISADPLVYQRAQELVTVVGATGDEGRAKVARGAPVIRPVVAASLLPRLTRFVNFQRFAQNSNDKLSSALAKDHGRPAKGEWVEAMPPSNVVNSLIACGDWPRIRTLVGVTETPLFRPDGSVHQERGYDEATGYLYAPSVAYPAIEAEPSQEAAAAALGRLSHVFCDFPYVDPSHAMVPVAAFLSVLARPAIDGPVPAFLFDASTRGSGKTLQADVVSLLATGRGAARANYPEKEEELAKVLMAYAMAGSPMVLLDNIVGRFGGGALDLVLTARDEVQFRVLGKNDAPRLPWRTVMMASGNNIDPAEDTQRRVLVARLESDMERPEERTGFVHDDLYGWVRDHRPELVADGLTVLRSFASHGRPSTGVKRWGSFEAWSTLIPAAIVFAGGADPMQSRPAPGSGGNDEMAAHAVILEGLHNLYEPMSAADIIRKLYPRTEQHNSLCDAIEMWVPTKPGQTPDHVAFGRRLRKAKGRPMGPYRLVVDGITHGVARWRVVKR